MEKNKKTILIVEDNVSLMKSLSDKFSLEGFSVLKAMNGAEGLEMAIQKHPDLILFDIVMPVMDGMTMIGHIRTDEWGKDVKAIVLTNLGGAEVPHHGYEYLVKSDWKIEDVVDKVRDRLNEK